MEGRALGVPAATSSTRSASIPTCCCVGNPVTDEFQHQFLALITPTDMDGDPNPYFDDVTNDNVPDGRVAIREGYIRAAYQEADETLTLARELMGEETRRRSSAPTTASRRSGTRSTPARCCPTPAPGAPRQISQLPRRPAGAARRHAGQGVLGRRHGADLHQPRRPRSGRHRARRHDYEAVRNQIIDAFQNLTDPANPGKQVVLKIMKKEELRNVDGSDSLHPSRSGDVVVVLRPPYQFDAATLGQRIAFSQFFGQHGYLPDLVDLAAQREHARDVHRVRAGDQEAKTPVPGIRAIDVAPTIAYLLGIPGPQNARGKILLNISRAVRSCAS